MEMEMETWKESQLIQLAHAKEIDTAYQISLNFVKSLGYKFCAFSITSHSNDAQCTNVNLNNFPLAWNTQYEQKHASEIDPIVAHCNHSMMPVLWSETLFSKTPWLWKLLQQQGLQHGWSQSIHDEQSDLSSTLSLARSHCPITAYELYENLGFTVFISHHLHALAALAQPQRPPRPEAPHLSPREIEVLKLSADGKTAYEVARILCLSERTVHFHVHRAIEKFGVNNKMAAVIAAARFHIL
jgi:DNA-binding CsgD family transcriptional regulator